MTKEQAIKLLSKETSVDEINKLKQQGLNKEEVTDKIQEAMNMGIEAIKNQTWISVDDRLPEPETMCCVTLKVRVVCFDYKINKQIGKEYIKNHMTEGYYNESMQWELELDNQLVCDYYGENGIWVWEDKISNERFEKGENKIIVDIVSDNKKEITRTTIEVLAWYPIMTEPYKEGEADENKEDH